MLRCGRNRKTSHAPTSLDVHVHLERSENTLVDYGVIEFVIFSVKNDFRVVRRNRHPSQRISRLFREFSSRSANQV
jgi:hypothetical protein